LTNPCGGPCPTPTPQICTTLSSSQWRIGPFPTTSENDLGVAVGESRDVFLDPFVESSCENAIVSVTWSAENPSVASVVAKERAYRGAG
jgi:hypothetical protein